MTNVEALRRLAQIECLTETEICPGAITQDLEVHQAFVTIRLALQSLEKLPEYHAEVETYRAGKLAGEPAYEG